ncbi:hypothetical protein PR202_ga13455 [Eleusine coracana subsp. coracana]|uniref:Uncharacterized protein n=1 Tax=Eleusine coracana subsp. coracana TaxID=191504 RepID=A0AAV5CEJ9_ELECO|nr:hypothetical protein PR202_ga13455 [Eleusine coracana subsp. coracana]
MLSRVGNHYLVVTTVSVQAPSIAAKQKHYREHVPEIDLVLVPLDAGVMVIRRLGRDGDSSGDDIPQHIYRRSGPPHGLCARTPQPQPPPSRTQGSPPSACRPIFLEHLR